MKKIVVEVVTDDLEDECIILLHSIRFVVGNGTRSAHRTYYDAKITVTDADVVYGCHCELEEGQKPDECLIGTPIAIDCIYAEKLSRKEDCKYWRPIDEK